MMQVFFALWGTAGMAGLIAICAQTGKWEDELQRNVALIVAILCGCMVASAVAGLVHMRRKESRWFSEQTEAALQSQTPAGNILIGLATLALGAAITAYTYDRTRQVGGGYYIMIGAMCFGALQALYGAGQYAQQRRRRKD